MNEKRVALVTGAGRGIGAQIALTLAKENTDIAVVDYAPAEAAAETLSALAAAGVTARYYSCDVSDFSATKAVVDQIVKDFGKIDVLVNNAGVTADKLILRMEEADWDRVLNINLKGCFNMIKHVTPYMMRKRYGRIVSISSVVGLMGNAGQANYAASKAGIIGLTKTVAKEFGARGITANAVAPGFIRTAMTDALPKSRSRRCTSSSRSALWAKRRISPTPSGSSSPTTPATSPASFSKWTGGCISEKDLGDFVLS